MSDEPKRRSRAGIGWALVAVFVLYPLSIGPMWWDQCNSRFVPKRAYLMISAPIRWFCERSKPLSDAADAYADWWAGPANR